MSIDNGPPPMPDQLFSVYQFFERGGYEKVLELVRIEHAARSAKYLTESIGARCGTTTRVIITDSGDSIVFHWEYGRGITFPEGLALTTQGGKR